MARPKNTDAVQNGCSISATENDSHELDDSAFDLDKLRTRMRALGIETVTELAQRADLSRGTLHEFLRTGDGSEKTIKAVLSVLKSTPRELQRQPSRQELAEQTHRLTPPGGWKVVSVEGPTLTAANGVSYQVAKLESTLVRGRHARGKFYDLLHVPPARLPELVERLTRHAEVCHRLEPAPRIARHLDLRRLAENTAWWVLDQWVDAAPLSTLLDEGVLLPGVQVKQIGCDILEGLISLHAHNIVMRELAPERVLVLDGSSNCVLTDFELATLLKGDISVSGKWKQTSPYRAPEVRDSDPHFQSDLYSWAMIVSEMLTGRPEIDEPALSKKLSGSRSRKAIVGLLIKCVDPRYHYRPSTAEEVLCTWNTWRV